MKTRDFINSDKFWHDYDGSWADYLPSFLIPREEDSKYSIAV
jgi:hypothetical protein